MAIELDRYLEDIENRLDPEQEERVYSAWLGWMNHENSGGVFKAPARRKSVSRLDWPHININDTIGDDTLAIYRELETLNSQLASGAESIMRIRPNFGVINIASAFGAKLFIMPYETDTLPNVHPMGEEAMTKLIENPLPSPYAGNFAAINRFAQRIKDIKRLYPKFAKYIHVEQPDLQGPMDNMELLWGSSFFYSLYDDEELVHAVLRKITDAIIMYMDSWISMMPDETPFATFFSHAEAGKICVRSDSAMNLSPELYRQFVMPYDGQLMKRYGGIIHFCGRGDHYIDLLSSYEGVRGVNMSQPHLNNMEKIFANTTDKGIHLSLSVNEFPVSGHDTRNLVFIS